MSRTKNISVVSSYATDRLIEARPGKVIREQKGGPVLYLAHALEKHGLHPEIFTGEKLLVEILVKQNDEFGSIKQKPERLPLPPIKTGSAIVSTILDEWDLSNAGEYPGLLFVDIQGYVRDGSDFGEKKAWEDVRNIAPFVFCLKGNTVEIGMLPPDIIENQKKDKMLIVTKDKAGTEVFFRGNHVISAPSRIVHPPNTIGAGDTFFANFVYQFMTTDNVESAAHFALDKTSEFLSKIK
ncbi:hypothetical protein HZB69_01045 [Candidatus Amesbacteria bacterium]|nr:hypothetical protein [Candidatus Amesbacteria bacterium]